MSHLRISRMRSSHYACWFGMAVRNVSGVGLCLGDTVTGNCTLCVGVSIVPSCRFLGVVGFWVS